VSATDVRPVFSADAIPDYPDVSSNFHGPALRDVAVQISSNCLQADVGSNLEIRLAGTAIGSTGFTGKVLHCRSQTIQCRFPAICSTD
jgi:hypothetical protein